MELLKIRQMMYGGDLATCQRSDYLYILENCVGIWKIDLLQTENYQATLWLQCVSYVAISVTIEGLILLIEQAVHLHSLQLFNKNASLLKTIQIPSEILEPHHALQTAKGNYILSFGWSCKDAHGVCELNDRGQVIRIFNPRFHWQLVTNPCHVALDLQGRVFTADEWNDRIVQLNDQLCFDQAIISGRPNGFQGPFRVSFDTSSNQLLVAHGRSLMDVVYRGNMVEVFKVK